MFTQMILLAIKILVIQILKEYFIIICGIFFQAILTHFVNFDVVPFWPIRKNEQRISKTDN